MWTYCDRPILRDWLQAASLALILASFIAFAETAAVSQSNAPDPAMQTLQNAKDKADLQKAIADDQKAIAQDEADKLKSQYSISTDKLPQGTATLGDKVNIEATILAYRAAQGASSRIADILAPIVKDPVRDCPSTFLFFDTKQMNDVWAASVLKEQLKLIQQQGTSLDKGPEAPRFFPVGAAIDAGLSLLSLFKTDVNIQGVPITGDDIALQAAIASDLQSRCSGSSIIDPAHFVPQVQAGANTILAILSAVSDLRNSVNDKAAKAQADAKAAQKTLDDGKAKLDTNAKAAADISARIQQVSKQLQEAKTPSEKAKLSKQLDAAKAELSRNTEEQRQLQHNVDVANAAITKLTIYSTQATAFVSGVDALTTALAKVDDSGITLLNRMLRAESLATEITANSRLLSVHFVAIAGNNITKKNFFSTSIAYSGGIVIDYLMIDNHGKILKSGIVPVYGKKVSEGDLNKTLP